MKKEQFTQKQKLSILQSAKDVGIKKAAELANIHYTSVYGWRNKLEALGEKGFLAYKPRTRGRGIKKITPEKEQQVLETWNRYPGFGPSQVRNQLRRQGITISTRTVERLMKANGYGGIRRKINKKATGRFEATRPLELAQIDILEYFINKQKVYIILLLDDYSRFIPGWRLVTETSIDTIIGVVQDAIDRYGKIEELLSDRGFVFYSWRGANRFERYLEVEGIYHTHARPHHPQTLGKVEAVNKEIQKELLHRKQFNSIGEAEAAIADWVTMYNYQRTHQGLGGFLVPADRFHGRVEEVKKSIAKGIDPDSKSCYPVDGIPRSIINVELGPNGVVTVYLLGHPIKIPGGDDGRKTEERGGGSTDSREEDSQGEGNAPGRRRESHL